MPWLSIINGPNSGVEVNVHEPSMSGHSEVTPTLRARLIQNLISSSLSYHPYTLAPFLLIAIAECITLCQLLIEVYIRNIWTDNSWKSKNISKIYSSGHEKHSQLYNILHRWWTSTLPFRLQVYTLEKNSNQQHESEKDHGYNTTWHTHCIHLFPEILYYLQYVIAILT